ncbi:MAG: wax ester/triacylglycerol synthase family O-acyltransferase [Acidimicrobiaceae bacterium]|nr:wax ester/triacylglycerol synthase family O-acyltransferase [Acidimicrobiaceae bacterium]
MPTDRMSPLDASFLHIEDDVTHMHIGAISVFEGPPPPYEHLLAMVAGKISQVPRYRQVVREVPLALGRPVWVTDPHFNLEYHLRHSALPQPGGMPELRRLVGRVMSQQLDRRKPLWEMWMVEGLEGGAWAVISKAHHAMVDGISGTDLLALLLDITPDAQPVEPVPWEAEPMPSAVQLAVDAVVERTISPFEQGRTVRALTRLPERAVAEISKAVTGFRAAGGVVRHSAGGLNGPIGPHRRWGGTVTTVDGVRRVRKSLGGTFNDVLLAAITRGFRDLLTSRGQPLDMPVRSMIPVSLRPREGAGPATSDGTVGNRVSAMFADLPVHLEDPAEVLAAVSEQLAGLKESKQALAGEVLTSLSGFTPPVLLAVGSRVAARAQKQVQTLTTNVPGPQFPLYAAGRRMTHAYPYVPLAAGLRIGVGMFSYDGEVTFGVTADYDSSPDYEIVLQGIDAGMRDLLAAAERSETG